MPPSTSVGRREATSAEDVAAPVHAVLCEPVVVDRTEQTPARDVPNAEID